MRGAISTAACEAATPCTNGFSRVRSTARSLKENFTCLRAKQLT